MSPSVKSPTPLCLTPRATPSLWFWKAVFVCACVCDSLPPLLALYGYFEAVGRLTLHTLPAIVKDWSSRLYHMIYITSWLLRKKFHHQQTVPLSHTADLFKFHLTG